MGNTQNSYIKKGFRVLKIQNSSPLMSANLSVLADFILEPNPNMISNKDLMIEFKVFSIITGNIRKINVNLQGKELNATFRQQYLNQQSILKILKVAKDSPLQRRKIIPNQSYIIGMIEKEYYSIKQFMSVIKKAIYDNKPSIQIGVYQIIKGYELVRIELSELKEWMKKKNGILGCQLGEGLVNRIPRKNLNQISENNEVNLQRIKKNNQVQKIKQKLQQLPKIQNVTQINKQKSSESSIQNKVLQNQQTTKQILENNSLTSKQKHENIKNKIPAVEISQKIQKQQIQQKIMIPLNKQSINNTMVINQPNQKPPNDLRQKINSQQSIINNEKQFQQKLTKNQICKCQPFNSECQYCCLQTKWKHYFYCKKIKKIYGIPKNMLFCT